MRIKLKKLVLTIALVTFIYICSALRMKTTDLPDQKVLNSKAIPAIREMVPRAVDRMTVSSTRDRLSLELDGSNTSCGTVRRPHPQHVIYRNRKWQVLRENDEEIFIISAFFDDRSASGLLPYVRLLAVSRVLKHTLYCQLWYNDHEIPFTVELQVLRTGRGDTLSGVKYDQSLYSCKVPVTSPPPTHVSISTDPCANSTIYLPVTVSIRSTWELEFGVCVAISFGSIPVEQFVEWMELNKIFGVSEFNIYDGNISPDMDKLFHHYNSVEKVLRVYDMPPPILDSSKKAVKLSSPASLNHCMLQNMYRYRYLVIIDFDEFIVPRTHDNYTSMLQDIDAKAGAPQKSYTFRNEYYFDHFIQDQFQPKHLRTMRFRNHAPTSKFLYAAKSFIDPKKCLSVFNHYCYKRFSKGKKFTFDVPTTFASSHHYRSCNLSKSKCKDLSRYPVFEDFIVKYKEELMMRTQKVFRAIGHHSAVL